MNIQSAINKEVFIPRDERMLVAVEVRRRKKKRMSFLPTGSKGEYATFLCLSVTNKKPPQLLITKVKRFGDSSSFTRRSQWTVDQLKQVNGVDPNKDSADFDLIFDNATDEWVACSSAEKCIFVQILYHACQTYWEGSLGTKLPDKKARRSPSLDEQLAKAGPSKGQTSPKPKSQSLQARRKSYPPPRQTEFINCQSKLTAEACTMNLVIYRCKAFFDRMKKMMVRPRGRSPARGQAGQRLPGATLGSVVHKAQQALGERGDKLKTAETKTIDLMHKAQRFADTAHKASAHKVSAQKVSAQKVAQKKK